MARRCGKSVAKFSAGQKVEVTFNPVRLDPRVPDQVNGKLPGRGKYQTMPDPGVIMEVRETATGTFYLVEVELTNRYTSATGAERVVTSYRKRVIPESKLKAV
jgi:hypothetical protein